MAFKREYLFLYGKIYEILNLVLIFSYTFDWSCNQGLQTVFWLKMWIIWKIYNRRYEQKPPLLEEYHKSLVNTKKFPNWLFRKELLHVAAVFSFFMIWTQRQSQCRLSQRPFYSREQLFRINWRHMKRTYGSLVHICYQVSSRLSLH